MSTGEQQLRARLQGYEAPGEAEAAERGRRLALAAFAERTPARRWRARVPRIVWPALAALLAVSAVAIAGYVREDSSPRQVRASFVPVKVGTGVVLALGRGLALTLDGHGHVRALGPARDGDLSPHGSNAVLASGSGLVAVHVADGHVRWRVAAPGPVTLPRWSLERTVPPCCRVAYLVSGPRGGLFAVGGDGRGAHRIAPRALAIAPAWRPAGAGHELAYVAAGGVRILAADSGRVRVRIAVARRPLGLSWRPDGRVLAVLDAAGVTLYRASGKRLQRLPVQGGVALDGGFASARDRLVVLRRDDDGRTSVLVGGAGRPLAPVRRLALTAVGDLRLSPDGRTALLASREGDEWIRIRLVDGRVERLPRVGERLRAGFAPRALAWAG
jgi:hypothetical protein